MATAAGIMLAALIIQDQEISVILQILVHEHLQRACLPSRGIQEQWPTIQQLRTKLCGRQSWSFLIKSIKCQEGWHISTRQNYAPRSPPPYKATLCESCTPTIVSTPSASRSTSGPPKSISYCSGIFPGSFLTRQQGVLRPSKVQTIVY